MGPRSLQAYKDKLYRQNVKEEFEIRVKSTFLSQRPRKESPLIALISIMSILFISLLCWKDPQLFNLLAAIPDRVVEHHEYWRLITAIGVHADLRHFFSNMLFLIFFSYLLYGYLGSWVYPILVAICGGLTNYFSLLTYTEPIRLVGASGIIYVMASFWLILYVLVQRTRSLPKRVMHVIGIGVLVLVPTNLSPAVSYRTHAIGFVIGAICAAGYFQIKKTQIRSMESIEIEPY